MSQACWLAGARRCLALFAASATSQTAVTTTTFENPDTATAWRCRPAAGTRRAPARSRPSARSSSTPRRARRRAPPRRSSWRWAPRPCPDDAGKAPPPSRRASARRSSARSCRRPCAARPTTAASRSTTSPQAVEDNASRVHCHVTCPEIKFLALGERRATVRYLDHAGDALSPDGARAQGRLRAAQGSDRRVLLRASGCSPARSSRPMRSAVVVVFPAPTATATSRSRWRQVTGGPVAMVWHGDAAVPAADLIVLPGGFAYGDYLRCGAMAAHSPVMRDVVGQGQGRHARARHLQRLPGADRDRPAAGRADAQRLAQVRLPRRPPQGRAARHALHPPLPQGRDRPHSHRPRRRQLLRRPRHARPARGRGPRRLPLRRRGRQRHPRGQPQRRPAQHRRHLRPDAAASSA